MIGELPYFWPAIKRQRIHARCVLDIGDNITGPIYDQVTDASEWDHTAERVSLSVKDNIWANIPGDEA